MARHQVLLELGPPQVQVAVLEAEILVHLDVAIEVEGERRRTAQHANRLGHHFHEPGGNLRVGTRAERHDTFHLHDVLEPHVAHRGTRRRGRTLITDGLHASVTIPEQHEGDPAHVTGILGPALHDHVLPDMVRPQLPAGVGTTNGLQHPGSRATRG